MADFLKTQYSGVLTLAKFQDSVSMISPDPNWSFPVCESLVRTVNLEQQAALLSKWDQKRSHYTPLSYLILFSPMLYMLFLVFSYTKITHWICFLFHPCVFQDIKSCQLFASQSITVHFPEIQLTFQKLGDES